MKTKTQHTPTPWKVQFYEETQGPNFGNSVSEIHNDGVSICKTINTPTHSREWCQESDANMAFIVRAVNSHKALLDAAKFSLSVHKAQGLFDMSEKMAAEKLKKAIAAAEGGRL